MGALRSASRTLRGFLKVSQPNLFIGEVSGQPRTGFGDDVGDQMRSVGERLEVACDGRRELSGLQDTLERKAI